MIPHVDFFYFVFGKIEDTIICFRDLLTFNEIRTWTSLRNPWIQLGEFMNTCPFTIVQTVTDCSRTHLNYMALEPVCCKKQQKIIPDQLLVWGVVFSKPVTGQELFLDVSYSKPALVCNHTVNSETGPPRLARPHSLVLAWILPEKIVRGGPEK